MIRPLAWIDLETTGLLHRSDHILQVCCIITDQNLNIVSPVFDQVIKAHIGTLRRMDPYVRAMHKRTGLWEKCLGSKNSVKKVDSELRQFMDTYMPKTSTLAGSSVHFDKVFIDKYMPKSASKLSHRILDVSAINEFGVRHNPALMANKPKKKHTHNAQSDILESIEELRWYRDNYFKAPVVEVAEVAEVAETEEAGEGEKQA